MGEGIGALHGVRLRMRSIFPRLRELRALSYAILLYGASGWVALYSQSAQQSPQALVKDASYNEVRGDGTDRRPYRYTLHKVDESKDTTKEIVETKDGDIAKLTRVGGQPLTPDRAKAEQDRLDNLLAHPEEQARRHRREQQDSGRSDKMVKLLPEAFVYEYEGTAEGASGPVIKLRFKPNSAFNPPDREAQVYHGMAGELWIDERQKRMVRLDAHLIDDVDFGWGIVGKLYKGGSILVEQADVGSGHWETTHLLLKLAGKALMVKSLNIHTEETATGFSPVPKGITYQEAIKMLQAPPSPGMVAAQ